MQRKDWVRLTKRQRRAIRHRLRRAGSAAERRRLNAVALYDVGQSMEAIAQMLCCSVGSISLDLRRWRRERFAGLAPKPCGGSEPKVSQEQFAALEAALEAPPSEVGYCAGTSDAAADGALSGGTGGSAEAPHRECEPAAGGARVAAVAAAAGDGAGKTPSGKRSWPPSRRQKGGAGSGPRHRDPL